MKYIAFAQIGFALVIAINGFVLNAIQSEVYMDEIFHVRQTCKWVNHDFTWDDKITTFPGLYLIGVAWTYVVQATTHFGCTPGILRSLNWLALCGLGFTASSLHQLLHTSGSTKQQTDAVEKTSALVGLTVQTFPVLFSTSLLFYTDTFSVWLVLSCVYNCCKASRAPMLNAASLDLHGHVPQGTLAPIWRDICLRPHARRYMITGLFTGWAAILLRQTNIVWLIAAGGMGCVRLARVEFALLGLERRAAAAQSGDASVGPPTSRTSEDVKLLAARVYVAQHSPETLSRAVYVVFGHSGRVLRRVLQDVGVWGVLYGLMVFGGFGMFVYINDGVVLGHHEHHAPVVHVAQLCYLGGVVGVYALVAAYGSEASRRAVSSSVKKLLQNRRMAWTVAVMFALGTEALRRGTYSHPFLLADNRHASFYVWRWFLGRLTASRHLLFPLWALLGGIGWTVAAGQVGATAPTAVVLAAAITLVPVQLLEFRYFIIPIALAIVFTATDRRSCLALILAHTAIHAVQQYLFLFRPFSYNDEEIGRFVW